jgi:chromosome segregation ATPase
LSIKESISEQFTTDPRKFFAEACCFSPDDKATGEILPVWSACDNLVFQPLSKERAAADDTRDASDVQYRERHQQEDSRDDAEDRNSELDDAEEYGSETSPNVTLPVQLEELKTRFRELTAVNMHLLRQQQGDDMSAGASVASPRNRRGKREKLDGDKPKTLDINLNNVEEVHAKCTTLESELEILFHQMTLAVTEKQTKGDKSFHRMNRLKATVAELQRRIDDKQAQVENLTVQADASEGKSTAIALELNVTQDQLQVFSSQAAQYKVELVSLQEKFDSTIKMTEEEAFQVEKKYSSQLNSLTEKLEDTEKKYREYVNNADSRIAFLEGQGMDQRKTIDVLTEQLRSSRESEIALRTEYSGNFEEELRKSAVKTANLRVQVESLENELEQSHETVKMTQDENSKLRQQLLEMSQVILKVSRDTQTHVDRLEKEKDDAERIFDEQIAKERSYQNEIRHRLSRSMKTAIATERAIAEAKYNHLVFHQRNSRNDRKSPGTVTIEAELALAVQEAKSQRKFVDELLDQLDAAIEEKSTLHVAVDDLQQRMDSLQTQNQQLQVQVESSRFVRTLLPTFGLPSLSARQTSENQQLKFQLEEAVTQLADLEMSNFELRSKLENADKKVVSYAEMTKEAQHIAEREKEVALRYFEGLDKEKSRYKELQAETDQIRIQMESLSATASMYQEKIEEQHRVLEALQAEKEALEATLRDDLAKQEHDALLADAASRIESLEFEKVHLSDEVSRLGQRCAVLEAELSEERLKFNVSREDSTGNFSERPDLEKNELEAEVKTLKEKCASLASKLAEARAKQKPSRPQDQSPATPKKPSTPSNKAKSFERKLPDDEIKSLKETCLSLEKELADLRNQMNASGADQTTVVGEKENKQRELDALQAKCSSIEDELSKTRHEHDAVLCTAAEIEKQNQILTEDIAQSSKEVAQRIQEIEDIRAMNIELESKVTELSEKISQMSCESSVTSGTTVAESDEIPNRVARSTSVILNTKEVMYQAQLEFLKIEHESKLAENSAIIHELTESRLQAQLQLQSVEKESACWLEAYQFEKSSLEKEVGLLRNELSSLRSVGPGGSDTSIETNDKRPQTDEGPFDANAGGVVLSSKLEVCAPSAELLNEPTKRENAEPELTALRMEIHSEESFSFLSSQIETLEEQKKAIQNDAARMKEEANIKIEELCSGIVGLDQKIATLEEQARLSDEAARVKMEELVSQITCLEMEKRALEEQLEEHTGNEAALETQLKVAKAELEVVRGSLEETEQHRQSIQSKLVETGERHAMKLKSIDEAHAKELASAASQIETLKKQKNELLSVERENAQARTLALSTEVNEYKQQLRLESEKVRSAKSDLEGLEQEIKELREAHENAIMFTKSENDRQMNELSETLKTAMKAITEDATSQYVILESEAEELRSRLVQTSSTLSKTESELAWLRAELDETVANNKDTLNKLQLEHSSRLDELSYQKAEILSLEQQRDDLSAQLGEATKEAQRKGSELESHIAELEARVKEQQEEAKKEIDRALSHIESLESQLTNARANASTQLGEVGSKMLSLEQQRDDLSAQLREATEEAKRKGSELESHIAEMASLRAELDETVANHKDILNKLQSDHSSRLDELLSQKSDVEARAKKQQVETKKEMDRALSLIELLESQATEFHENSSSQLGKANATILSLEQQRDDLSAQLGEATEEAKRTDSEFQSNIAEIKERLASTEAALQAAKEELAHSEAKLSSTEQEFANAKALSSELRSLLESGDGEKSALQSRLERERQEHSNIQDRLQAQNLELAQSVEELAQQLDQKMTEYKEFSLRHQKSEKKIQSYKSSLSALSTQLKETTILYTKLQASQQETEERLEAAREELHNEHTKHEATKVELAETNDQKASLTNKNDDLVKQIELLNQSNSKLHGDIEQIRTQSEQKEEQLASAITESKRMESQFNSELENAHQNYKKLEKERDSLSSDMEDLKNAHISLNIDKQRVENDLVATKLEMETLSAAHEASLQTSETEVREIASKNDTLRTELAQVSAQLQVTQDKLSEATSQFQKLSQDKEDLSGRYQTMTVDFQAATDRIFALQTGLSEANDKLAQTESQSVVFQGDLKKRVVELQESQSHVQELKKRLDELQVAMSDEVARKDDALDRMEAEKKELELIIDSQETKIRVLETNNTSTMLELQEEKTKLSHMKQSITSLAGVLEEASSAKKSLSERIKQLEEERETERQDLVTAESQIKELRDIKIRLDGDIKALNEDLEQKCVALADADRREESLNAEMAKAREEVSDEKFANTLLKNFIGTLNTTNDSLQTKCNSLEAQLKSSAPLDRLDMLTKERDALLATKTKLSLRIDTILEANKRIETKLQDSMEKNASLETKMSETKATISKLNQAIESMNNERKQSSRAAETRESGLAKEVVTLQLQLETLKRQLELHRSVEQRQGLVAAKSNVELEELKKSYSLLAAECNELQLEVAQEREQSNIANDDLQAALSRGQMLEEELQQAEQSLMELTHHMEFMNQQEEFEGETVGPSRVVTRQSRDDIPAIRDEFLDAASGDSDDVPYDQRSKASAHTNTSSDHRHRPTDSDDMRVASPAEPMDARACRKQSMARRNAKRPPSGPRVTFDDGSVSSYSRKSPALFPDDRSVESNAHSRLRASMDDRSVESSTSFKKNGSFWNRR